MVCSFYRREILKTIALQKWNYGGISLRSPATFLVSLSNVRLSCELLGFDVEDFYENEGNENEEEIMMKENKNGLWKNEEF